MEKVILCSIILIGVALVLAGCQWVYAGHTKNETKVIERDDAESLAVNVKLGTGELKLSPGTDDWLDGQFEYNGSKSRPNVSYQRDGKQGQLDISQKRKKMNVNFGNKHNKWNLQLNEDILTELNVETGAGKSHLDLSGMLLEDLNINTGVGEATIDLSGDWEKSFNVKVDSGVGDTNISIPRDVGVKVIADKGIGDIKVVGLIAKGDSYVNEAYEDGAEVMIEIDVDMGIGEIEILTK